MSDPLNPDPQTLNPPGSLPRLRSRIDAYAKNNNLAVARVNQRVRTELIIAVLNRARDQDVIPKFHIKGGMALEIRFGMRARASGDLDVGLHGTGVVDHIDRALALGLDDDITFERRKDIQHLTNANTERIEVKILYRGRPIGSIQVDVNESLDEPVSETATTSVLTQFGLPGPLEVPLLDVHVQLAHKLHGGTEPSRTDYTNLRYKDVIDALVIAKQGDIDFKKMRGIAEREFGRRAVHRTWPPMWRLPGAWQQPLEAEAKRHNFSPANSLEIEAELLRLIARIEGLTVMPNQQIIFLNLEARTTGSGDPLMLEAQKRLDDALADGWKILHLGPHRSFVDLFVAALVREQSAADSTIDGLPRLQLRLNTQTNMANQWEMLTGNLRNETPHAANRVRIFVTANEGLEKFGTITQGDGDLLFSMRYDNQVMRNTFVQFPAVYVQYLTDDGRKVQQIGKLQTYGPDASGRYGYTGRGLEGPTIIEAFKYAHDTGELP